MLEVGVGVVTLVAVGVEIQAGVGVEVPAGVGEVTLEGDGEVILVAVVSAEDISRALEEVQCGVEGVVGVHPTVEVVGAVSKHSLLIKKHMIN